MFEIKTLREIEKFEKSKKISSGFANYLKDYLEQLKVSLENHVPIEDFSLEDYGHFVILKNHEDCRKVPELSLEDEEDGLLAITAEFVNEIFIDGTEKYYLIGVLCNNEFMLLVYLPLPCPPEISEYLKEFIV